MSEQNLTPAAPESSGSAPGGTEQVGSAPGGSEQVGSAPAATEQVGSAPGGTDQLDSRPGGDTAPGGSEQVGSAPGGTDQLGSAPARSRGRSVLILVISALVALVVVGGVWALVRRDETKAATAGSCIANLPEVSPGEQKQAKNAKVVDCGSAEAAYKVEGRVDDKTLEQAQSQAVCQPFPGTEFVYYSVPPGGRGYVLCLSQIPKGR